MFESPAERHDPAKDVIGGLRLFGAFEAHPGEEVTIFAHCSGDAKTSVRSRRARKLDEVGIGKRRRLFLR